MKMEVSHLAGRSVPVEEERALDEMLGAAWRQTRGPGREEKLSMLGLECALQEHWPEYLIEAMGLGFFMISACLFAVLIFHPSSPMNGTVTSPLLQRALMGVMMGLTAIAIIYSPWGKRSGAHINPSVTLTFLRLGKVGAWDALFYTVAQFTGAITGVLVSSLVLGNLISDPSVNYVTTVPGPQGPFVAFIAEVLISFLLMTAILFASNHECFARWTGVIAGVLVAIYISIESPLSGMSMNAARTFGSAVGAWRWTAIWLYFTAPPVGMLMAAEVYTRTRGRERVMCAKLHHRNNQRCIFRCGYKEEGNHEKNT
jgi:aquaporin Z